MKLLKLGLVLCCIGAPFGVVTANEAVNQITQRSAELDFSKLAELALSKLEQIDSDDWTFTQTTTYQERVEVEKFDPRQPPEQRWQLISKNDQPPSEKQLKKYNKRMNNQSDEPDEQTREVELSDMISNVTLLSVSDNGQLATYSFAPVIEDLADEPEKLNGLLVIDVAKQMITQMEVTNNAELSPAFSVTLDKFKLEFEFTLIENRPVLFSAHTKIDGTIGFFKSLDQDQLQQFSNYLYVGG